MNNWDLVFVCTTHNPMGSLRWDLLEQTMQTARVAFPACQMVLLNNHSTDGSDEAQRELSGRYCAHYSYGGSNVSNHSPGSGRTTAWGVVSGLMKFPLAARCNLTKTIIVMSDDDMKWSPNAKEWILSFWKDAPEDVAILCAYLEPEFEWNKIRRVIDTGHVRALVRDSAPGAAWTFRMDLGQLIFPVPMTFGYDHKTCLKLAMMGKSVAQIDLCEHMGWEVSSHGNDSVLHSKPVDKAKWGL